jgi:hypothetical protein
MSAASLHSREIIWRWALAAIVASAEQDLSRRGHLARLHLIEPPPGSPREIDAAREQGRIRSYFQARKLGMTPAQIVASRTRAESGPRWRAPR